jgi:hypothetical protein
MVTQLVKTSLAFADPAGYYRVQNNPPLEHIVSQMNPFNSDDPIALTLIGIQYCPPLMDGI